MTSSTTLKTAQITSAPVASHSSSGAHINLDESVTRRAWSLLGNSQRLDGGSMFGNAPRALWSRWIEPDELNRIPLACRCLLIEEERPSGTRRILCEAGIGAFFEPKLRERFGVVEREHILLERLTELGLSADDIDVVVLSHLHFDHAGGLLSTWSEGQAPELVFKRASYVVGERALERARDPHPRDRASFIPILTELLVQTGRLEIVGASESSAELEDRSIGDESKGKSKSDTLQSSTLGAGYCFHVSDGHTPGQLLIEITGAEGPLVFCGDLIPGIPWVHLPITMGYDRFPELLIEEKSALLNDMLERGGRLFFTHDSEHACAALQRDERGRFSALNPCVALCGEPL